MYISKIQVLNYKSFLDSGELEFSPDMNIIIGQNNAGKTALLEALSLKFSNVPHRSMKTLPSASSKLDEKSIVKIKLSFTKDEFSTFLDKLDPNSIGIVLPNSDISTENLLKYFLEWLENPELGEFTFDLSSEGNLIEKSIQIKGLTSFFNLFHIIKSSASYRKTDWVYLKKGCGNSLVIDAEKDNHFPEKTKNLYIEFFYYLKKQIYRLSAERFNLESSFFGDNNQLNPDASNLGEVLNILQGRGTQRIFNLYNKYVSIIFPHIKEVAVKPKKPNSLNNNSYPEVRIWSKEAADNEREDLSFSLSECGTGIGQVLAILYVVITSQEPRTIIIDEPQSFLHPGAAKKLIEILKLFPQHQYFISTHSPEIVTTANASTIMQLRYEDSETKVERISLNILQMRSLLSEVGISLSDVFGADNIIWVEGETEELCFPMILEKVAKPSLQGTQIVALKHTGDLDTKNVEMILEIYRRLSGGNTLFPPAIGFLLDDEGRDETKKKDLKRTASKLENHVVQRKGVTSEKGIPLKFLPRCMYENYLLHAKAIAVVLNSQFNEYGIHDKTVTDADVQEFLNQKKADRAYFPKNAKIDDWDYKVNGAKILEEVFQKFADTIPFKKTTHSLLITKWLVEKEPEHLSELKELLQDMLNYESEGK